MFSNFLRQFFAFFVFAVVLSGFLIQTNAQSRRQQPPAGQTNQKKNQRPDPNAPQPAPTPPEDANPIKDTEVLTIKTNIINVDSVVYHKKSKQIITGLKQKNFEIYEDGVKQEISNFAEPESPITVTLVVDYSKTASALAYYGSRGYDPGKMEMVRPVAMFLSRFIKPPDDYASVIAFDIRPTPLTDFTNNPGRINQVITLLLNNNPAFTDSNLFDALKLTLVGGRADSVVLENSKDEKMDYAGLVNVSAKRRAVILVGTGIDSMSKINYDQARKIVQAAGIPIYVIGTGEMFLKMYDNQIGAQDTISGFPGRLTLLQAKNTLGTFAKESGGMYFPVTFESELPSVLNSINALLRSQYSLAYDAGNERFDGKKRKIEVRVDVNNDGKFDEAEQKQYEVQHRPFYTPPKGEDAKK
ncbi:MAG TPA: VWA domain-containing protein [Pyrinomonadaceae bacterium]|jgi:VWFA-related protein